MRPDLDAWARDIDITESDQHAILLAGPDNVLDAWCRYVDQREAEGVDTFNAVVEADMRFNRVALQESLDRDQHSLF